VGAVDQVVVQVIRLERVVQVAVEPEDHIIMLGGVVLQIKVLQEALRGVLARGQLILEVVVEALVPLELVQLMEGLEETEVLGLQLIF
jgi:hypothetical protein